MAEPSDAGPSSSADETITDAHLLEADLQFQQGIQAIKTNDLDKAVELFGLVLQTRCQKYGEVHVKCASTYFRYGAALFYKAQDEQDVFGAPLQAATADNVEAAEAEDDESEDEKENVDDKGKKPMREEDLPQAAEAGQMEEAEEDAGDRADMELAWENLEVAKYIYEHDPDGTHIQELADIHSLLADIGMEQENFESALQDHRQTLQLLGDLPQADDRRLAELHYKACLTLQYLERPEEGLKDIKTAVKLLEGRIDSIKAAAAPAPAPATTAPTTDAPSAAAPATVAPATAAPAAAAPAATAPAAASGAPGPSAPGQVAVKDSKPAGSSDPSDLEPASAKELEDLEGVLEDMYEKVEELQQIVKEQLSTKKALKAAFSQIAGSFGSAQLGQGSSSSSGAGPSTAPAPAVVDLGVVGRGMRRVTPMPFPPTSTSGSSVVPASKAAPQKRSFEDLMGGGSSSSLAGTSTIGFMQGTFSSNAPGPSSKAPWPQALGDIKKQKTQLSEKSMNAPAVQLKTDLGKANGAAGPVKTNEATPLPAFLQPAVVAATYSSPKATSDQQN